MNTDKHRSDEEERSEEHLHADVTHRVIGVFYDVYNELGHGFLESVYQAAMEIALEETGLKVGRLVPVPVWFRGRKIGEFIADVMVEDVVFLELKAVRTFDRARIATVELPAGDLNRSWPLVELRTKATDETAGLRQSTKATPRSARLNCLCPL
jgi:GxxExxY protein